MSEREDYGKLADDLDDQADELEQRSQKFGEDIGDVSQDWQRKRADEGVPGAPPPDDDDADEDADEDDDEDEDEDADEDEDDDEEEDDDED